MFQCLIKKAPRLRRNEHTNENASQPRKIPKMQLITSVIDLEHDIAREGMKRSRKYLKYDSISGNLHQFFSNPGFCLGSRSNFFSLPIHATVNRVILIVSAP